MHSIQKSLNAFRKRLVRTLTLAGTQQPTKELLAYSAIVPPNGESWHKSRDMPSRKHSVVPWLHVDIPTGGAFDKGAQFALSTKFLFWRQKLTSQ
jgi:hypothetical protein